MSNYAALVDVLSIAGSRKSDGTANASGTVYFFQPGTNTQVNAYSDAAATAIITQPVTLTAGGLLNRSTFPAGIYVIQPVRVFIQDVSGNTVADTTYVPATAGDVGVNNAGFTDSTLDGALTKAFTSLGGQDWKYLISTGQTPLKYKDALTAIAVNVKAFGAVGDGIAIDTTAIQAAINFVKAAGGGVVLFPPGTFLIDQALTLSSANGVTFLGAGIAATIIKSSHATASVFTLTSCKSIVFEAMELSNSGVSTGSAVALTSCTSVKFIEFGSDPFQVVNGYYRYGVDVTSSAPVNFFGCRIFVKNTDAAARCVRLTSSTANFVGGSFSAAAGHNWEIAGTPGQVTSVGVQHGGSDVFFAAGLTLSDGVRFAFWGGSGLFFTISNATIPYIVQFNTSDILSGSATSSAVGASQTPILYKGTEVLLTATSGGAGTVTVNAPAVLPGTAATDTNLYWDFVFKNASGGAVTWSLNGVFVTSAAIPTTDAHTIGVRFRWDRTTSKLREVSRADTVT